MNIIIKILFVCLQCYTYLSWAADAQNIHLGFFYCPYLIPNNCGVEPPCISRNSLCAHENVYSNGKGDTVFLLPVVKCYTPMKNFNETGSIPANQLFASLIDFYGTNFQERCQESLHDTIYQITQIERVELDSAMQNNIACLNNLYHFFKSSELSNILKTI